MQRARFLGELKKAGYQTRSVKDEMRSNLMRRLERDEPGTSGLVETTDSRPCAGLANGRNTGSLVEVLFAARLSGLGRGDFRLFRRHSVLDHSSTSAACSIYVAVLRERLTGACWF